MKRFLLFMLTGLMLCAASGIHAEPAKKNVSGQNLTAPQKGKKKMKQSIKILAIGNSFSISAGRLMPSFALADGNGIKFTSACIGGCSLERHCQELEKSEADPNSRPYDYTIWHIANGRVRLEWVSEKRGGTLIDMLKDDVYDVITIQQASHFSWQPDTYQPFADTLIARIRKEQPQAKIMVQQTWSYRCQDGRFNNTWDIDQTEMYNRLDAAYKKLADQYGFLRIPTGTAVQIARAKFPIKFQKISEEELATYRWPDLPSQAGDVVGAMQWGKDKDGKRRIVQDNIHLNTRGEYLQAAVWYGAIYGVDPRTVDCKHPVIDDEDAAFLRECAYEALKAEGLLP